MGLKCDLCMLGHLVMFELSGYFPEIFSKVESWAGITHGAGWNIWEESGWL